MRIVILDDIRYNLAYLNQLLMHMGHEVEQTVSPYQALELLKTEDDIEAVFTDLQMPDLDGINFQSECRKKLRVELGKDLPAFILFSAFKENKTEREALEKGFLAFLKKPFNKDEIQEALEKVLAGEHLKFNQVKKVLLVTEDAAINDYLSTILPTNAFQINWVTNIEEALVAYKKDFSLAAILCTPNIGVGNALLLKLSLTDNIRYSDTGIVNEPPFVIMFSQGDFETKREQVEYIAKATIQGVKEIINLTENPGKILEALGSDVNLQLRTSQNPPKVLVVDDIAFNRAVVKNVLKRMDVEVVEASTGNEALSKYRNDPDIRFVISDLLLPDINGDELLERCYQIKRMGTKGEVESAPFVMMTASQDKKKIEKSLNSGFIDWMAKPVNIQRIEALTKEALKIA